MRLVLEALHACGAVFVRHGKHDIYRLPNGRTFVLARTASDRRAEQNALKVLRRLLTQRCATINPPLPTNLPPTGE